MNSAVDRVAKAVKVFRTGRSLLNSSAGAGIIAFNNK
jgi:hypothetical protein